MDLSESELSALRQQLATQAHQIEELQKRISSLSTAAVVQSTPMQVASKDVAVPIDVQSAASPPVLDEQEPVSEYISDSEEESRLAQSIVQESLVEEIPPEELMPPSDDVDIILELDASSTNKLHLSTRSEDEVLCSVPRDISSDDLVFEVLHK